MLRAAHLVENLGIPTASIITTGFLQQARVVLKGLGMELAIAEYPGNPVVDTLEQLEHKVESDLTPALSKALTGESLADAAAASEPAAGSVVFSGTFDEVQDYFERQMWGDGLPIVPPTPARINRFLEFCERGPHEVLALVPLEGREVTIHSIAVCGAMAGCRPQYMPILVAAIEAMCDKQFRIEACGSTPGWEPMVMVNGPIIKELDLNCGEGVMRMGRRANSSIGRFVRLYLRNICGFRIPPGAGDKGSIGQSFLVAFAENEDAARECGWTTYAEERGFEPTENVVTVRSVVSMTPPIFSSGERAVDHMHEWAQVMTRAFGSWVFADFKAGMGGALVIVPPCIARVVARDCGKEQVRRYIYDHALVTAESVEHYAHAIGNKLFALEKLVEDGVLPASYAQSADPQRRVHMFIRPETIEIAVAGDPNRNQSRAYMVNNNQGVPTSRQVQLPRQWSELVKQPVDAS